MLELPPIFKWPGGKKWLARRLVRAFPPHKVYGEPFAGGASAFFEKELAEINVLNDKDPWPITFFEDARRGGLRGCKIDPGQDPRGYFERLKKQNPQDSCGKLAISTLSFHGSHNKFIGDRGLLTPQSGRFGESKFKNLDEYERKLRRAWLTNKDFERTLKDFDSPDSFFFMDPPWVANDKSDIASYNKHYKKGLRDPLLARVLKAVLALSGKFLIIYNDCEAVRQTFAGQPNLHVYRFHGRQNDPTGGGKGSRQGSYLVITNYRIK